MMGLAQWGVLTNVAYLVAALLVAWHGGPAGWGFIAVMANQMVTSGGYHAGLPRWVHLDVIGMYALGLYLFVYLLAGPGWWAPASLVLILPAAWWLRMKQLDVPMEVKIAALFGVLYATAFMFRGLDPWLLSSLATIIVALLVRPRSHALWHPVSAAGLAMLYQGLR